MRIIPIAIDGRPAALGEGPAWLSLATLPHGTGQLIESLADRAAAWFSEPLRVLLAAEPDPVAARAVIAGALGDPQRVLDRGQLFALVEQLEPSDWLVWFDLQYLPPADFDSRLLRTHAHSETDALYLVAAQNIAGGAREYVRTAVDGRVSSIRRYYEHITHQRTAGVAAALVPAAALHLAERARVDSLSDLRAALAVQGVPGRDRVVAGLLALDTPAGLLALAESSAAQAAPHTDYRSPAPNILIHHTADVAADARLVGPIVIQSHARVRAGATIIGPALIGRSAEVAAGATVALSLLLPEATVPPAGVVHLRVLGGDATLAETHAPAAPVAPEPNAPWQVVDERGEQIESHAVYETVKLAFDVTVAAASLLVLAPLLAVVAALVRLDSPGPLFFGHLREGRGGRTFRCWKFRTMRKDAHAQQRQMSQANAVDGPQFKIDNDPRVTRVGRWLRALNIDELPQLWNVLLGEMSLIGPRPSPFRENQICVPWRQARLSVRPGITGLWQVCRHQRGAGDFHQWIHYDILYVRHMSAWLDTKVFLATLASLGGRWAVPVEWLIPRRRAARPRPAPLTGAPA